MLTVFVVRARKLLIIPVRNKAYEVCVEFIIVNSELQNGLPVVINDVRNPIIPY